MIGPGRIGSTVGALWVKAGYEVMFSSRHLDEVKKLIYGIGPNAHAGTSCSTPATRLTVAPATWGTQRRRKIRGTASVAFLPGVRLVRASKLVEGVGFEPVVVGPLALTK